MLEIAILQARLFSTKFFSFPYNDVKFNKAQGDAHTVKGKVPPLANQEQEKDINLFQKGPLTYTSQPGQ